MHGYTSDANGLMRLGHRYYDASTGRFISRDPIHDGYNWYTYCYNNPVSLIDPKGTNPPQQRIRIGMYKNLYPLKELILEEDNGTPRLDLKFDSPYPSFCIYDDPKDITIKPPSVS